MLSQALKTIRVFHDLKQVEGAALLCISRSHLSEIEKGIKTPSLQLIEKYAEVYDIPISSIFFFAENAGSTSSHEQARLIVAPKILALLQFLEGRFNVSDEKKAKTVHT